MHILSLYWIYVLVVLDPGYHAKSIFDLKSGKQVLHF